MKEKLLIISSIIPYPLTHGGAIAQYYFLEKLSEKFTILFNAIITKKDDEEAVRQLTAALPNIKVIPFYFIKKQDNLTIKDKSILLMRLFLNFLRRQTYNEDVTKGDDFNNNTYPVQLFTKEYIQFLENLIEKQEIKIVQLEFSNTLSLLKALPKHVKKVAVIHEITTKRLMLAAKSSPGSEAYKQYVISCYKLVEYNLLKDADQLIVFNEDDKDLLSSINSNVALSPFGIPKKLLIRNKRSEKFDHFLFIGGQHHDPNRTGLEWFLKEIYIANYAALLPLYIVGKWDDSFKEKYKSNAKIIFTGIVEDLKPYYDNAIMVTPVLSGSGLRTKILHAFANKIPVLSTTFAGEGLLNKEGANPHIILFDTAADFIIQAEELLRDPQKLQILAEEGFFYYEKNFDEKNLVNKRLKALA